MILPEDEEFLAHYGKKGMRWGVRKSAEVKTPEKIPGIKAKVDKRAKQDADAYINAKAISIKAKKSGVTTFGPFGIASFNPKAGTVITGRNVKSNTRNGLDPSARYGTKQAKKNLKKISKPIKKSRRKDMAYDLAFRTYAVNNAEFFVQTPAGKRIMNVKKSSISNRKTKKAEAKLVSQLLDGIV